MGILLHKMYKNSDEEQDDLELKSFFDWCRSETAETMRKVAGMDKAEGESGLDWVSELLDKEIRLNSDLKFTGSVFGPELENDVVVEGSSWIKQQDTPETRVLLSHASST